MIEIYRFLKKARLKKKLGLYKQAIMLTFDFTSVFYVLLLVGYFIYSIISEGGLLESIRNIFSFLDTNNLTMLIPLLLFFPLIQFTKGIKQSGITFTESDYKLLMLPYQPKSIWFTLFFERMVSALVKYSLIGLVIVFLTPISMKLVSLVMMYLLIINALS